MFTINQIKEAHAKVKSGADFPAYIQDMKSLGVLSYAHFVSDGSIHYQGSDQFRISGHVKWLPMKVMENGSTDKLKHALIIHQRGETDYPTFCKQAAAAGVEKWIVDMDKMVCRYYDKSSNELLVEAIPTPK